MLLNGGWGFVFHALDVFLRKRGNESVQITESREDTMLVRLRPGPLDGYVIIDNALLYSITTFISYYY